MMNITTYITHNTVKAWHFKEIHRDIIQKILPDAQITLCETEDDLLQALPQTDVILTWTFRQEWFLLAPRLKVLSTPAAGKDYFHVTPPEGVLSLNGHYHGEIIAETVAGMILSMTRGLLHSVTTLKDTPWSRLELQDYQRPLRGSTVAILGFGHIGRWIGQLLKPFGVHILGMVRNTHAPLPDWFDKDDRLFTKAELNGILPLVNHLVLALPATPETTNIITRERLELLPDGATLTNVGRGNAIVEADLIDALKSGHLHGACLDVFQQEPLPANSPLRTTPNLWIMPHASAIADTYLELYAREVAEDIKEIFGRN